MLLSVHNAKATIPMLNSHCIMMPCIHCKILTRRKKANSNLETSTANQALPKPNYSLIPSFN
jgi:hypothetical protein